MTLCQPMWFIGGKLCSIGYCEWFRNLLTPLINGFPPDKSQPFVDKSFGPLPMRPPSHPELLIVPRCRHRIWISWDHAPKYTQRPASVEVRSHDQHSRIVAVSEACLDILRFVPGGQSLNRTNTHRRFLR